MHPCASSALKGGIKKLVDSQTWFPSSPQERDSLYARHGIVVSFVAPEVSDPDVDMIEKEVPGSVMRLRGVEDRWSRLPDKVHAFLAEAAERYDARYLVKLDDDIWVNWERLAAALRQWDNEKADYVGERRRERRGMKRKGIRGGLVSS